MKHLLTFAAALFIGHTAMGLVEIGESPKNYCWKDVADNTICLEDAAIANKVRVLLYNGGFCPPCNQEFSELSRETAQFKGKPVVFLSLSASGWNSTDAPNKKFLQEWRDKHGLAKTAAKVIVAASPHDAGRDFFADPRIPSVVVVDTNGEVSYKAINPGIRTIASEVKKVLPKTVPIPVP